MVRLADCHVTLPRTKKLFSYLVFFSIVSYIHSARPNKRAHDLARSSKLLDLVPSAKLRLVCIVKYQLLFLFICPPGMAGKFANALNAKKLILTHVSQRYKASHCELKEGEESVEKLVHQAKLCFSGEVVVAEDLSTVTIPLPKS